MKILIKPSDLIKRFIWDKYETFCLNDKTNAEIDAIIKNDIEFYISENDAFVIGLTNVIYTDNVIYKYKVFLKEALENKSFDFAVKDKKISDDDNDENNDSDDSDVYVPAKLMINRDIMTDFANAFISKIPKSYDITKENKAFIDQYLKIKELTDIFTKKLNSLPVVIINDWNCVKYVSVKKLINKLIKD